MDILKQGAILLISATVVYVQAGRTTINKTTMSPLDVLRQIRQNKTIKDADLIIKMTQEFVRDMAQRMVVINRIQQDYAKSSAFTTGTVFSDIQKTFKHMCDLYSGFATVRRYVLGHKLNQTMQPNPDVVVIFQFMLSDYNEIGMLMELFKVVQHSWQKGDVNAKSRDLIKHQLEKFGNIPAELLKPIDEVTANTNAAATTSKAAMRKWSLGEGRSSPRQWSGGRDGIGFDDR